MKLPGNVHRMPHFLGKYYRGQAVVNQIFLREDIYDDLQKDNPIPENVGILLHEQEHIKRIKMHGWLKFGLMYLFSGRFRFEEELAANKPRMKYLKSVGAEYDIDHSAKALSDPFYLWCVKEDVARERLRDMWNQS